jgi:CheY-like chemotaxis protein
MTGPTVQLKDGARLDGVRVLVVDDAPYVRQVVTDILTEDGARVTAVGSAEEALAALQAPWHNWRPSDRSGLQEVHMTNKVRVNLANAHELLELVGISETEVRTIVRFRAEHGPIVDGQQLSAVLSGRPMTAAILERADFAPSEATAPEAPGA